MHRTKKQRTPKDISREEAIRSGLLVDFGLRGWQAIAVAAGFDMPAAFTRRVFQEVVSWGVKQSDKELGIHVASLLSHVRESMRLHGEDSIIDFYFLLRSTGKPHHIQLKCLCGPDDEQRPSIIIMFADEEWIGPQPSKAFKRPPIVGVPHCECRGEDALKT
jgi:hypothetical protein